MADELVLRVRSDVRELSRVAAAVERFGVAHGMDEKDIFDVTLALDEVVTNVIWYAFEDEAEHDIVVRLGLDGGELHIEVEDDGRAFDPLSVPPVEEELTRGIEDRRVGGLGMYLVHQAMDALAYRREMGKNRLTMRKRVAARE